MLMDRILKTHFGQTHTLGEVEQKHMQWFAEVYMRTTGMNGMSVYSTTSSFIYGFMLENDVVEEPQIAFIGYRAFKNDI